MILFCKNLKAFSPNSLINISFNIMRTTFSLEKNVFVVLLNVSTSYLMDLTVKANIF